MYYRFYEDAYGIGPHEGIRTDEHKLIHYLYGDSAWELYNLKKDPAELHNVFGESACAEISKRLQAQLAALRGELQAETME